MLKLNRAEVNREEDDERNKNKGDDIFVVKITFFNINSSFRKVCGYTWLCSLRVSSTLKHTEVRLSLLHRSQAEPHDQVWRLLG